MDEEYPRILNGEGCLYGQECSRKIIKMEKKIHAIEGKLDKILWALVGVMISLATASITIWISCLMP